MVHKNRISLVGKFCLVVASLRSCSCSRLVTIFIFSTEYGNSRPQSMQHTYARPERSRCGWSAVLFGSEDIRAILGSSVHFSAEISR
jgi:hypothetical protein